MSAALRPSAVQPVRKSVTVPLGVTQAFELFTAGLDRWWPTATHSIGRDRVRCCALEPRVGGAVYEEHEDGTRCEWGRVLRWEPPERLVVSWHPGRDPEQAQEVEVRFLEATGGARVELEHRGWERLGEDALEVRDRYDEGWVPVLGAFTEAAETETEVAP